MSDVTLKEVLRAKADLERAIQALVHDFVQLAGVSVEAIQVYNIPQAGAPDTPLITLTVKL